ncbi:hypothetical protein [Leptolyngbya sp. FACHB-321]|nr:hypothetical protein [Leptolyngbya sp. FACHB-321]
MRVDERQALTATDSPIGEIGVSGSSFLAFDRRQHLMQWSDRLTE